MVKSVVKHIFDCFFFIFRTARNTHGWRVFGGFRFRAVRTLSMLPNAARYQLRYTPIVIKLWSCKWSNLWSNTVLTAFYHFPNRPKSARLKGFRRFSLSYGENTVYAPKCRALPTAPHPDKIFIFLKMQYRNKFVVKVEELSSMRFIRYCLYYSKIGGKCQLRKGNNVDLIQFTYKYRIYLFVI